MLNLFASPKKLVEKIHAEFDSAEDRLLAEAKLLLSNMDDDSNLKRLMSAGFTNSKDVSKYTSVKMNRELADLIEYYKMAYPFQKFITEAELNRICKKYGLIYAPVSNYIESVPLKNLKEIENAPSIRGEDKAISTVIFRCSCATGLTQKEKTSLKKGVTMNEDDFRIAANSHNLKVIFGRKISCLYETIEYSYERVDRSGLFIAAPPSHFDKTGLNKKSKYGFFNTTLIEVKDPIVFRYVRGGIQIITKWGLEGQDSSLTNEKYN